MRRLFTTADEAERDNSSWDPLLLLSGDTAFGKDLQSRCIISVHLLSIRIFVVQTIVWGSAYFPVQTRNETVSSAPGFDTLPQPWNRRGVVM